MRNESEINSAIDKIKAKLAENGISYHFNAPVKQGYQKAIDVLKSKETDITKAGLEEITSVQGQAIAALAIYYLAGDIPEAVLLGIPIKKVKEV